YLVTLAVRAAEGPRECLRERGHIWTERDLIHILRAQKVSHRPSRFLQHRVCAARRLECTRCVCVRSQVVLRYALYCPARHLRSRCIIKEDGATPLCLPVK